MAHAALGEGYAIRVMEVVGGALEVAKLAAPCARNARSSSIRRCRGDLVRAMVHQVAASPSCCWKALDRVMELDPNHPEALDWAGWSYMSMNQPEKGLPLLELLAATSPERYLAASFLGRATRCSGALMIFTACSSWLAIAASRSCAGIPRTCTRARSSESICTYLGEPEAGIAQCERAVEIAPADTRVRYNRHGLDSRRGRLDDCVNQLHEATRNLPEFIADWPLHHPTW